VIIIYYSINQC